MKLQPSGADSGTAQIVTEVVNKTTDATSIGNQFKDIAVGGGTVVPDLFKALTLFPMDDSDHGGDYFYARNNGERCFYRGGSWYHTAYAGVFYLYGAYPRTYSGANIGFRPALPGNPLTYSLRAVVRDQVKGYVSLPKSKKYRLGTDVL